MAARDIVILGLSLRSSWGNGHATTYRGLIAALQARGDRVVFLERDVPWYAEHQDPPAQLPCAPVLYASLEELQDRHAAAIAAADLVIVGSYVPDGIAVGAWVQQTARGVVGFYDIDTPVTLAALQRGDCAYLSPALIPHYDLYLSFTGGPTLQRLERVYGAPRAVPLYCAFDPEQYRPQPQAHRYDLGYMGTYSDDRQPPLERLLLQPAMAWPQGRFVVAGPLYPPHLVWPDNVPRCEHLPPAQHGAFYNQQRFTLNLTRADMVLAGWSPSVRLFEAAACATPIISDAWDGLETLFAPGKDILIARRTSEVLGWIRDLPEAQRLAIGEAGRRRVLAEHTAAHRAQTLHDALDRVADAATTSTPARSAPHALA
ncbi:glycosyltransferase [Xanthomonas sp. PPL139]|uniref:CgeB family protein n=1 Tax=unclassified Xanthomonas TaxID=2643310 RepID=UPI0033A1D294